MLAWGIFAYVLLNGPDYAGGSSACVFHKFQFVLAASVCRQAVVCQTDTWSHCLHQPAPDFGFQQLFTNSGARIIRVKRQYRSCCL